MLAPSSRPSRPGPPATARGYASMTTMQGVENLLGSNYMERLAQEVRPRPDDAHHLFIGEEQLSYSVPNENQQWHRALCNHEGLRKEFASFKGVASTSDVTKWLRENDPHIYHRCGLDPERTQVDHIIARKTNGQVDNIFNYALMESSVNAHFGKWATREKMLWVGPKPWATAEALMHMITQNGLWILNHH